MAEDGRNMDVGRSRRIGIFPVLSLEELFMLIFCVIIDILEYVVPILLSPFFGDLLDVFGILACITMFGWVGFLPILELIPLFDFFPVFIFTWITWYYLKQRTGKTGKLKDYLIATKIPDVDKESVSIQIIGKSLRIQALKKDGKPFVKTYRLPKGTIPDKFKHTYEKEQNLLIVKVSLKHALD